MGDPIPDPDPTTTPPAGAAADAAATPRARAGDPAAGAGGALSGRYVSGGPGVVLELRVDVDGPRALGRVSGDFFDDGSYLGSFELAAPVVAATPAQLTLEGAGAFTWPAGAPHLRVVIARGATTQAWVTFGAAAGGAQPAAAYACAFASPYFRTIALEQDAVEGTTPFVDYDTGALPVPDGSAPRTLSVAAAYAEAGIEVVAAGERDVVAVAEAGPGATHAWDDSELHAAMLDHFSLLADAPRWQVWLLVATRHVQGRRGVMFDPGGAFPRRGCAVFHEMIQGDDPAHRRAQLRTYVHELGHTLNLLHSWQKDEADPPQPLGPNGGLGELSWMNYPNLYQPPPPAAGGDDAFWGAFALRFTDAELAHIRHGPYRKVVMGGDALAAGGADADPALFSAAAEEPAAELELELRSAKRAFAYGEPVVVELRLATRDGRSHSVHPHLHPRDDLVRITIRLPSGRAVRYRPLMPGCPGADRSVTLDARTPAIYESAYVGFGRDGLLFGTPGDYALRAEYVARDGARVSSAVLALRVDAPCTPQDERAGELLMGDEQGALLYLLGSDAPSLAAGDAALDELLARHPDHPLAVYAQLLKGLNAGRDFKRVGAGRRVVVRPAQARQCVASLAQVAAASRAAPAAGVDDITLNAVLRSLARAHARAGDLERAGAVLDDMVGVFAARGRSGHVMASVRRQARDARAALADGGPIGAPPA